MPSDRPLSLLGRALVWALSWGLAAGAVEAAWHLNTWSLPAQLGSASGFFLRSVLYGIGFHVLWQLVVVGAAVSIPPLRRRVVGVGARPADAVSIGSLATGCLALHGFVWWRVGHHINDPWSSPVLAGGTLAVLGVAVITGVGVGAALSRNVGRLHRLWVWPVVGGVLLYAAVPASLRSRSPGTTPVRVLLVTLDTFRADRVSALGGSVDTPTLDDLAARGVIFEQAVAQAPITCPAHLSILSGTSPATHGVFANGTVIPADLPLLQEAFDASGVPTAGFVAGYPVTSRFGFDRGFQVFDDDFGDALGDHRLTVRRLIDQFVYARGAPRERSADQVLARAIPWIEAHADGGFFAWVHLFDPHGPYVAPAPFGESLAGALPPPVEGPEMPHYWPVRQRSVADPDYWILRYDEEIAYTDDRLGVLLEVLEREGVLEDTLVAVIADHGESLDEHEYYFDHGFHLYDASLRVPLILAGAGVGEGGRVACQVRGMDLAPTVLDLSGLPPFETMEGDSLRPLWEDGCPGEGLRFSLAATVEPPWLENPGAELALRSDGDARFKFVQHRRSDDQLFDLIADPDEVDDIAGQRIDIASWMHESLQTLTSGMDTEAPTLTEDVEAQLRALGYITDGPRAPTGDDDSAGDPGVP